MGNNNHRKNLPVPFFSQREVRYIWYQRRQNNDPIASTRQFLAHNTCNIVSLCMILHYFGITTDTPDQMLEKVFTPSVANPFQAWQRSPTGVDQLWQGANMARIVRELYRANVVIETSSLSNSISYAEDQIRNNYPVWFSFGPLHIGTQRDTPEWGKGHIAVIRGFTEDNDVIINDPWGDPTNPFGGLRTDANRRIVTNNTAGHFYNLSNYEPPNRYRGLGTGDNIVIKRRDFLNILRSRNNSGGLLTPQRFHQTLVIKYPHYWAFPLRDENGEVLRMSSAEPAHSETEEQREAFAQAQMERMRGFIRGGPIGFPVSSLGMPHHSLPLASANELPVYAMGPGRLIAAMLFPPALNFRRTKSPCFALVQHRYVARNGGAANSREFFSLYAHLRPFNAIEINKMIERRLYYGFNSDEAVQTIDWIEQIIDKIMPKKAITRGAGSPDGLINARLPRIWKKGDQNTIDETDEFLPDRGLIFLAPYENELEKLVRTIDPLFENERRLSELFKKVNNRESYMEFQGNNRFYRFYYYNKTTSSMEIRYTRVDNYRIIPQRVNIRSYVYYRKKIADLMRGGAVAFLGEDKEIEREVLNAGVQKRRRDIVFRENIQSVFPDIFPTNHPTANIAQDIQRVTNHFLENELDYNDLLDNYLELSGLLLRINHDLVVQPFVIDYDIGNNGWSQLLLRSLNAVISSYLTDESGSADEQKIEDEQNRAKYIFLDNLHHHFPTNIDYHIEVNLNTKLGYMGLETPARREQQPQYITNFSTFSTRNIIENAEDTYDQARQNFVLVTDMGRGPFCDCHKIVELLTNAGVFTEEFFKYLNNRIIKDEELSRFYTHLLPSIRVVNRHRINFSPFDRRAFEVSFAQSSGFLNIMTPEKMAQYNDQMWFTDDLARDFRRASIDLRPNSNIHSYHPIGLFWTFLLANRP